jgi:hypothetical protein
MNKNKMNKNKKGQEEMVGFTVIIILVAVIILVFLGFALQNRGESKAIESYEIESFLQSVIQYTTEYNLQHIYMQELIKECDIYDEGCTELNNELENILEKSWNVEEGSKIRGYKLIIYTKDREIINIKKGNETQTFRGHSQQLTDNSIISMEIYS